MKKLLKQLLAVTTAIMMAITLLPAMANAEENNYGAENTFVMKKGRITVHKTTQDSQTSLEGAGFTVYTALTFKQDSNGKIVVDENNTGKTISDVNTADFKKIIGSFTSAEQVKKKYGQHVARTEQLTESNGETVGETVFENLDPGIYIVAETTVPTATNTTYYESVPFIVSLPSTSGQDGNGNNIGTSEEAGTKWIYDIKATPKNNAAFGEKKITDVSSQEGKNPGTVDDKNTTASANIGDTVSYEITATSPTKGSDTFNVTDKIKGLEVDKSTIVVKAQGKEENLTEGTDYNVENITEPGFKVAFTKKWIDANPNTRITISYSATVTSDAKIGTDANTNKAIIDFGHEKSQETNTPKVYTYGFTLTKEGEGENEKLEGVKFALLNKDKAQIEEKETDKDGLVTFDGLAAGTYYLKETKTASGYTLLANLIKITISAPAADTRATFKYDYDGENKEATLSQEDNGNARFMFTVTNKKGFNLPSTGGMGTYIFTIGGLVVMAGAVLLLVSSKKKRA